jgi:1,5-anhydro-D-fructose reductase (1,5-anhydro-D-mannitol-forming)
MLNDSTANLRHLSTDQSIGWAIVGASWIAERWMIGAIEAADGSHVTGVYSSSPERGNAYAERNGLARAYASLDDLLGDPDVGVVYIGTTNERHRDETIAAAAARKHVLCEKPLALSVADAVAMRDACRDAGVVMGTNHHLRCAGTHRRMRELIKEGAVGEVLSARVHHTRYLPEVLQTWRLSDPGGGGIILDITVHDTDTVRFILDDEIERVSAMTMQQGLGSGDVEDGVVGAMRLRSGAHVVFHEAFTHPHSGTAFEVHGREAVLIGREIMNADPSGDLILRRDGLPDETVEVLDRSNLYERAVRSFNAATRGEGQPAATAEDGIASLAVALAVREAARSGATVEVPQLDAR